MKNKIEVYVLNASEFNENDAPSKEKIIALGKNMSLEKFTEEFNSLALGDVNQGNQWITFKERESGYSPESELRNKVDDWFNRTFNNISLTVFEKIVKDEMDYIPVMANEEEWLTDFIKYDSNEIEELRNEFEEECLNEGESYSDEEFRDWLKDQDAFISYKEDKEGDNYPMWGTVFEFKHEPGDDVIDLCLKQGLVVIESTDEFNTTIGVAGAGFSFYGNFWIPLWLSLPWNDDHRKKYKDVNYRSL